jgi:hypothetical protein
LLGVDPGLIEKNGAVSLEVAEAMADGALGALRRRHCRCDHWSRGPGRRDRGEARRLRLLVREDN